MFPFLRKAPMLQPLEQQFVVQAIRDAEAGTSGEVRVFVERRCSWMDAADRAQELFVKLNMHETEERNGVLVYLAIADRQFAILGDEAIFHRAGGPVFWEAAALQMRDLLRQGRMADALAAGVRELGRALANNFPPKPGINKNELPDEIVFGK